MVSNFGSHPTGNMCPAIQRKYNDHCCCICSMDDDLHWCQIQKDLFDRSELSVVRNSGGGGHVFNSAYSSAAVHNGKTYKSIDMSAGVLLQRFVVRIWNKPGSE